MIILHIEFGGNIMGKNLNKFATEKIQVLLMTIALPIFITYLVGELYNMVDMYFIGNYSTSAEVGAMMLVFPFQRIVIALATMIAIGTSTSFSQNIGSRDYESARNYLDGGFTLLLMLLIPAAITLSFNAKNILGMGSSSAAMVEYAASYMKYTGVGLFFLGSGMFFSNILLTLGNNKVGLISTSIGTVMNIVLDYIFLKVLGMGIEGAAIATLVSQIIAFAYVAIVFVLSIKELNIKLSLRLDNKIFKLVVLLGISTFVIEAEDGILMSVLSSLLTNSVGDNGLIILSVVSKIYMFSFITVCSVAAAMQPIVSYCAGAENDKRIKKTKEVTRNIALIATTIVWIIQFIFAENFIRLFVGDEHIVAEAVQCFRIMTAVFPVVSIYYVNIYFFQAIGNSKMAIRTAIIRQLVLMIPISIFLVKVVGLGAMGVWLAYPICDLLSAGLSTLIYRHHEHKVQEEKQYKLAIGTIK